MTELVRRSEIERLVGAGRSPGAHLGRADSEAGTVYILHSQRCLDSGIDLRECMYSLALDNGIDMDAWDGHEDQATLLWVTHEGGLVPSPFGHVEVPIHLGPDDESSQTRCCNRNAHELLAHRMTYDESLVTCTGSRR